MPIYEYKCGKGHTFEVMQRMADDPISKCTVCARPVQRVFHPIAVHFKGSGFYNTDYGKKGAKADKEKHSDADSSDSKSSDSKSSDSKSSDSKSGSDSKSSDSKSGSDSKKPPDAKKDKGASKASSPAKS